MATRFIAPRDLEFEAEQRMWTDDLTIRDGFLLFWGGWPSQWYPSVFEIDGVQYNCAEQYMMAEKARLFKDEDMLDKILCSPYPMAQKGFGRAVENFCAEEWDPVSWEVVERGSYAKYTQDFFLKKKLLATGTLHIVEASPEDKIWGIGIGEKDPRATKVDEWEGENRLGQILMKVRDRIVGEEG